MTRPLNVGFTGSRTGMSALQKSLFERELDTLRFQKDLPLTWFHHGDCIGSDQEAHLIARHLGCEIYLHPPADQRFRAFCTASYEARPYTYMIRNARIVVEADFMFATPNSASRAGSGTWATILRSRQHTRPLCIIMPDGEIIKERWL